MYFSLLGQRKVHKEKPPVCPGPFGLPSLEHIIAAGQKLGRLLAGLRQFGPCFRTHALSSARTKWGFKNKFDKMPSW